MTAKPVSKPKYYSLAKIQSKKATYNVIFGERSNGKTYATLTHALKKFFKNGDEFVYLRRWGEDVKPTRMKQAFAGHNASGIVSELSGGRYTNIHFNRGRFYAANYDEEGKVIYNDMDVIGYPKALTEVEHDKSTSYPNVKTIIFDEFIAKNYLPEEFVIMCNVISTIVRRRNDVEIYMLGNTINKYCVYFKEMGLTNIPNQKQGSIDVYTYGDSDLRVAVEYCKSNSEVNGSSPSDVYFAFDNPKLNMITGGAWELDIYPHLPIKYKPKDVLFHYFIEFDNSIYHAEIVSVDNVAFTYIHLKTTPIKNDDDLVFSFRNSPKPNHIKNMLVVIFEFQKKILYFFKAHKVYYQDNSVGNAIENYITTCIAARRNIN